MRRYPKIGIRSKYELAKRISDRALPYRAALALINDAVANHNRYWYDSKQSEPEREKFVRSAKGTPLGKLLKLIDKKVLGPHDSFVPDFIFGGIGGKDHVQAARYLLGAKRQRVLLGLDVTHFFEQIRERRVFHFFYDKCDCSKEASMLFARLCCVPMGPKKAPLAEKSLARGFATSTRLALWCNLDTFLEISRTAQKRFRGHDLRIAVFVDDIGITASRISYEDMKGFAPIVENILKNFDPNQSLPVNSTKYKIRTNLQVMEHLGVRLGRNKLTPGRKTRLKIDELRNALKEPLSREERKKLLKKKGSYYAYKRHLEAVKK
jgi:hypothetical protein